MLATGADALPTTLGATPAYAAAHWPQRQALYFEGHFWTFAELDAQVDRAAAGLLAAGVRPRDKVALWITNRPEFMFAFFGALRIGAVAVPLNTRWRTRDLLQALRHCEASTLISEVEAGPVDFREMVQEALGDVRPAGEHALSSANCPALRRVVFLSSHSVPCTLRWGDMLALASRVAPDAVERMAREVAPEGVAMLIYTSGTTGEPKAVMLSHKGIAPSLHRAAALGISEQSVQIVYLPLFHIYGLIFAVLPSLLTGVKQVLMHRFDASEALRLIEEQRGTILHGFDTHYKELLEAYLAPGANYDISSLQWGTFSAGTDTARSVALKVQQILCRTISTYGQSEVWGAVAAGPAGCTVEQSCEASGMPLPGVEVRIVDPVTQVNVAPGELGEIFVRCESSMLGYYNAPEATRATRDEQGWVRTGDAGRLRADGHLRFLGRFKDMLKVGGENVDPAEIEALLLECPLVRQAAVVGCPDERLSEVPAAFIVPAAGALPDDIRRQVDALCRGRVASFKIPRRVEVVAAMPVNAAGKVDKKVLRQQLQVGNR
ncbi:MAG TPA: class I adenylate-forming enzyme family protein [Ramlibacter sp.]|nr:class I adenylate-forming enzyme family protein [Ramlibacter sp.]